MAQTLPHKLLNNPRGVSSVFNLQRGQGDDEEEGNAIKKNPEVYKKQKENFKNYLNKYIYDVNERKIGRNLSIPEHIEFIKIKFFIIFNDNSPYKILSRFRDKFGLSPVRFEDFNQTITFAITNEQMFPDFLKLLNRFINSPDTVDPHSTEYSILTSILDFELITSKIIVKSIFEENVLFELFDPFQIAYKFRSIFNALKSYLDNLKLQSSTFDYSFEELNNLLEIKNISKETVKNIVDNFDIIHTVQTLKSPKASPGEFNQSKLNYGFKILPDDSAPLVGVLDTGVRMIDPLRPIIKNFNLDIVDKNNPAPFFDDDGHGTAIASLISLGADFYKKELPEYTTAANIVPIKILSDSSGIIQINEIINVIRKANKDYGIRLFNLSVNHNCSKSYNSTVSEYAYALDKLSYEIDILIFISAGNLGSDDLKNLKEMSENDLHRYPSHFYNPYKSSDYHVCEATNICPPADSFNNVTIGALADNLQTRITDMTVDSSLPAYYSRKFYYDYRAEINGTYFQKNQRNFNIFKPDLVFPGGDSIISDAGMQVIGFGDRPGSFFISNAGTSYSTPLATNIAAKILKKYPKLNMQSVKAIMVNSASLEYNSSFLSSLLEGIKEQESKFRFNKSFADLTRGEKMEISSLLKGDNMLKYLCGHGKPDEDLCLNSYPSRITMVIEDNIKVKTHKTITVKLPDYLNNLGNDQGTSGILTITATLCYKFDPIQDNHLAYCPLHISFNLLNCLAESEELNSRIVSDKNHEYFNQFYEEGMSPEDKTEVRNKLLGIKTKMESWSDEFYPVNSKPFANTQKKSINIRPIDLNKTNNKVSIVIRAINKNNLEPGIVSSLLEKNHSFSIVISIEEKPKFNEDKLYNEIEILNTLEDIIQLDGLNVDELQAEID